MPIHGTDVRNNTMDLRSLQRTTSRSMGWQPQRQKYLGMGSSRNRKEPMGQNLGRSKLQQKPQQMVGRLRTATGRHLRGSRSQQMHRPHTTHQNMGRQIPIPSRGQGRNQASLSRLPPRNYKQLLTRTMLSEPRGPGRNNKTIPRRTLRRQPRRMAPRLATTTGRSIKTWLNN